MPPEEPRYPCWKWNPLGSDMQTLLPQLSSCQPLPTVTEILSEPQFVYLSIDKNTQRKIIKTIRITYFVNGNVINEVLFGLRAVLFN